MKNMLTRCLPLIISCVFFQNAISQVIPFNPDQWIIESQGAIIDGYEGEANALLLQGGTATPKDVSFQNGFIEFDIFLAKRRGFPGVLFRMQDDSNYEEFYVRPHQSGNPDAMQYTPVFNGLAAWQLYHDQGKPIQDGRVTWGMAGKEGYNAVYTFPHDRWLHVKMVVSGTRMDVYFDHEEVPTLQVRELLQQPVFGALCLRATSPVYFANFSITEMDAPRLSPLPPATREPLEFTIQKWQISNPFDEQILEGRYQLEEDFLKNRTWQLLTSSAATGLGNISKVTAPKDRSENTVLAKTVINSSETQVKRIDFGYSDRVRVYCNGQLLYSGNNGFRTRDYRYLGTIGYFDSVYLPLKNGENEVVFAVSESFGGWGIQAKLENMMKVSSVE